MLLLRRYSLHSLLRGSKLRAPTSISQYIFTFPPRAPIEYLSALILASFHIDAVGPFASFLSNHTSLPDAYLPHRSAIIDSEPLLRQEILSKLPMPTISDFQLTDQDLRIALVYALLALRESEELRTDLEERNHNLLGIVELATAVQSMAVEQQTRLKEVKADALALKESTKEAGRTLDHLATTIHDLREDHDILIRGLGR
jgi:hypothetical protein